MIVHYAAKTRLLQYAVQLAVRVLVQRVKVLTQGALPQLGILGNNRHRLPKILQTQGRNVDVVNVHSALCRLENTEERECERRFACARATHDADALTGAGLERYIAQHGLQIRAVLRRVVTELYHTARRPRWRRLRLWNMSLTLHRQARVRHDALNTHDVLLDLGS